MFFIVSDNWKTLFFTQIYSYAEVCCNRHVAGLFELSFLKEIHILCALSPH